MKHIASLNLFLGAALCSPYATAEPYLTSSDGTMVLDKATRLIWQRCHLGRQWDGKTCSGEPRAFSSAAEAQQLAGTEWRVPTLRELHTLVYCSTGKTEGTVDPGDGGGSLPKSCAGNFRRPAINDAAFPSNDKYFAYSSMSATAGTEGPWFIEFGSPRYFFDIRSSPFKRGVLLVRSLKSPTEQSQFKHLLPVAGSEAANALRILLAQGPQAIYLKAGLAHRSGSVSLGGQEYDAQDLYELIINRFPKSEFAVKAADQIASNSRSSRERSAQAAQTDAANRAAESRSSQSPSDRGRGGLKRTIRLEATRGYAAECIGGYSDTLTRSASGKWCAGSAVGDYQCFDSPAETALHMCR